MPSLSQGTAAVLKTNGLPASVLDVQDLTVVGELGSSHISIVGVSPQLALVGNLTSLESSGNPIVAEWNAGQSPRPLTHEFSLAHAVDSSGTVVGHLPASGQAFVYHESTGLEPLDHPAGSDCDAYCSLGHQLVGGSCRSQTGVEACLWSDTEPRRLSQFASVTCLAPGVVAGRTSSGTAFRMTGDRVEVLDLIGQHFPVAVMADGSIALTVRTSNSSAIAVWAGDGKVEMLAGLGAGRDVLVGVCESGGMLIYGLTLEGALAHALIIDGTLTVLTGRAVEGLRIETVTAIGALGHLGGIASHGRARHGVLLKLQPK